MLRENNRVCGTKSNCGLAAGRRIGMMASARAAPFALPFRRVESARVFGRGRLSDFERPWDESRRGE